MPRSQAGLAASVASTSRQVGTSLGVALAGSIAGAGIDAARHTELAVSTHPMFWLIVAFGVAIALLGVVSTGEAPLFANKQRYEELASGDNHK